MSEELPEVRIEDDALRISYAGWELTVTMSQYDSVPLLFVDTGGLGEDARGPRCRILLNDDPIWENPRHPLAVPVDAQTTIICATYGAGRYSDPDSAVLYRVVHTAPDPLEAIRQAAQTYVRQQADAGAPWPHSSFNIGDALECVPPALLEAQGILSFAPLGTRPDLLVAHDADLL